jgi:O-antigen/teichoic acid export membrane protein
MLSQKAKVNTFTGNTVWIFLTRFFPTLANTLVLIFFSRQLDTDIYGAYQNFWVQLLLLSTLGALGLQSFLFTYTPDVLAVIIKRFKTKQYVQLSVWVILLGIVFAWLQADKISLPVSVAFLVVYSFTVIAESILLAFRYLKGIVVMNMLHMLVFLLMHYLFLKGILSFDRLFVALLMLYVVKLLVCAVWVNDNVKKHYQPATEIEIKSIRNLWLHMGLYDVLQIVFKYVDKFIISILLAESVSAIYYNGSQDVPFLPILLGAVGGAALMQLSADKAEDAPVVVVNKTARILSALVFPVFFFLVCFRYELFTVILTNRYEASVPIFLMSILVLPLRAYNFTVVLQNKHKGNLINKGALLDMVLACVLMYPLYLLLGLPGVALSFVVSTYLQAAYYLYHTSRVLDVKWHKLLPLTNWCTKLIIFAIVFIGIHYWLSTVFEPQIVLIWGVVFTIVTALVTFIIDFKTVKRIYGNA